MLQVLFGLGAVIFVHELGHFLAAKSCGVKCEKFYVGFDVPIKLFGQTILPAKLIHWQWGETEYGIGSIPLGGYVKMLGQDDNPGTMEEQIRDSMAEGENTEEAFLASGLVDQSKLDPRSFLAKSVIQRMWIISAGVIFNLIFAVFFAAWAFKTGVDYDPPMVGNVVGGGPAWTQNLAGAEVEQIGEKKVNRGKEYFTYMDMAQEIIFNGDEQALSLKVKRYGETETSTIAVTPQKGYVRQAQDLALLGLSRRTSPVIGSEGAIKGNVAADADPPFEPDDVIVEVNGIPIKTDIDLRRALALEASQIATFVLERKTGEPESEETERVTTTVQPNPMRDFGFSLEWEPIAAIRVGSPAETAGLKVGDEIITVNDQPRGDLLTLDQRMIQAVKNSETVELGVNRDGEMMTISIVPGLPNIIPDLGPDKPVAVDSLGVAIATTLKVEAVESGGAAAKSGLKIGDELKSVKFVLTDDQNKEEMNSGLRKKPINFVSDTTSWAEVAKIMQRLEPGSTIELSVKRSGTDETLIMSSAASKEFFLETRGIFLEPLKWHYVSDNWSDAFKYGRHQVWNDATRVFKTLVKLVRGKISPTNLGGPGTIAMAATSEATRGTSNLLLFLTFLSANLAIVNFLPIPILDGGHMLFLAYEGIFRRPVTEYVKMVLTYVGLAMILSLMAFVIFLDLTRMIGAF
ncbi:MAG: site-2 protease family protein [Mariniblastus sp.]